MVKDARGVPLLERSSKETSDDQRISQEDDKPLYPFLEKILLYKIIFTYSPCPSRPFQIKDKGESDWLAKSLVLLQTSWFVMQCIARAIEHLPVTYLKIVTFAYAAMNFVI